jgi:hypothetical protein
MSVRTDLTKLQQEIDQITYEIHVSQTNPKKIIELQTQRAPLIAKAQQLQEQLDKEKRDAKANATKQSIIAELQFWVFQINGNPVPLDSTLRFKVKYPCGHEEHNSLNDLIPFEREDLYHSIRNGNAMSQTRVCQKCRAERKKRLEEKRLYNLKPTPHVFWKLHYRV